MNERPDIEQIKLDLAAAIVRLIDERKLSDQAASEKLTLAPTAIGRMRAGDVATFSIDHLIAVLHDLDQGVAVAVIPARKVSTDTRPIWEKIADIAASIPREEWDKLPTDLAANHDHYLYGTPKRY